MNIHSSKPQIQIVENLALASSVKRSVDEPLVLTAQWTLGAAEARRCEWVLQREPFRSSAVLPPTPGAISGEIMIDPEFQGSPVVGFGIEVETENLSAPLTLYLRITEQDELGCPIGLPSNIVKVETILNSNDVPAGQSGW